MKRAEKSPHNHIELRNTTSSVTKKQQGKNID